MDRMPIDWFLEMPPVTRLWVLGIVATSIAEQFHFISPLHLLYNPSQVFKYGEYWRLVTCFLYFGKLNVNLFFNVYFVVRYSRIIEESMGGTGMHLGGGGNGGRQLFEGQPNNDDQRMLMQVLGAGENNNNNNNGEGARENRGSIKDFLFEFFGLGNIATLDYLWMLVVIGSMLLVVSTYFQILGFLGPMLSGSLIYVWARRNPDVVLSFLGVFVFRAPYLPWIMLLFSSVMNNNGSYGGGVKRWLQTNTDLISICVGHIYFFFEDIFPALANGRRPLAPPWETWNFERVVAAPAPENNGNNNADNNENNNNTNRVEQPIDTNNVINRQQENERPVGENKPTGSNESNEKQKQNLSFDSSSKPIPKVSNVLETPRVDSSSSSQQDSFQEIDSN